MADSKERRLMIAMDESRYADYALDFYLKNLHQDKDYVILFHCVEFHQIMHMPLGVGGADVIASIIEDEKKKSKKYLEKLSNKMTEHGLHGKIKQVYGKPREEILRVAESEKAEFIITGTRGLGQVRRTLLGSVSDHVLHHSHVPVLICRHEDDHKHEHQGHGHHSHHS